MLVVATLLAFALPLSALARPSAYSVWAADSAISRGQANGLNPANGKAKVIYDDGEFQYALKRLYAKTGNTTYYNWIKLGVNGYVSSSGVGADYVLADYKLDPVRVGTTFLYLYEKTGEAKYKAAADQFRSQLNSHPRTAQGQFWHKLTYPNQGWLDGIYMGDVFYAEYTKKFQASNTTAWNDIATQFQLMYDNTIQTAGSANYSGLLYHGYDYSHSMSWASSDRGHSPEIWDRALGWYMMALVDTLDVFPTSHSGRQQLLVILQTLAPRVVAAADATSGVWWLVISQPGRAGNYFESSGAAMFIYSLLKAVRLGYVSDSNGSIVKAAKKAYSYTLNNWVKTNTNGTMDWYGTVSVGSLGGAGDYPYYISVATAVNDLKGLSAFVLASLEYEEL